MLQYKKLSSRLARLSNRIVTEYNWIKRNVLIEYRRFKRLAVVEIEGIRIKIGSHISESILQELYAGTYEEAELRIIKSQLSPSDVVMEIGTGIGLLSSYCAKQIGSERVYTYEANPALERPILDNYQLNNVFPSLKICLIGAQAGEQIFYIEPNFWSSSIIQRTPQSQAVNVPVKSFNREIQQINPTFLIIDIEGGEYELLQYADFHKVKKMAIEVHERVIGRDKVNFVISRLAEHGFKINKKISSKDKEELFLQR